MRYVCPRCGAVSREGLAIRAGPWCGKCGSEMKMVRRDKPVKNGDSGQRNDTPTNLEAV